MLSVITFHFFPTLLSGGFLGVDIFFVISGFLITRIILGQIAAERFSPLEFYNRRIKRILPALIIVLLVTLVSGYGLLLSDEYKSLGQHVFHSSFFANNFLLMRESGYFDPNATLKPLNHLWSLAVEEQFYLVWPLLLGFLAVKIERYTPVMVGLVIGSFTVNALYSNIDPEGNFFNPLSRFWEIGTGGLVAMIFSTNEPSLPDSSRQRLSTKHEALIVWSFAVILASLVFVSEADSQSWRSLPVVTATAVIIALGSDSRTTTLILSKPLLVRAGLVSYPAYLIHWPLLAFPHILLGIPPTNSYKVTAILLTFAMASAVYLLMETPIRRSESRFVSSMLVLILMITGIGGHFVYKANGLSDRGFVETYQDNLDGLNRETRIDDGCSHFLPSDEVVVDYCKGRLLGEHTRAIAVIGDSHAHVAYPGIAAGAAELGISSFLLANSSCPPLIDSIWGRSDGERSICRKKINQILNTVIRDTRIDTVIMFTRGPSYWTGQEPLLGSKAMEPDFSRKDFSSGLQRSIQLLINNQKSVFYVSENPELKVHPSGCLSRPLVDSAKKCAQPLGEVMKRQEDYLLVLDQLPDGVLVNSLKAFCTADTCTATDAEGRLLYADDDHLSMAGSMFQYQNLIAPLLIEQRRQLKNAPHSHYSGD